MGFDNGQMQISFIYLFSVLSAQYVLAIVLWNGVHWWENQTLPSGSLPSSERNRQENTVIIKEWWWMLSGNKQAGVRESGEGVWGGVSLKGWWSGCDVNAEEKSEQECPGRRHSKYRGSEVPGSWLAWRPERIACGQSAVTCNRLMVDFRRCRVTSITFHAFLTIFETHLSRRTKIN